MDEKLTESLANVLSRAEGREFESRSLQRKLCNQTQVHRKKLSPEIQERPREVLGLFPEGGSYSLSFERRKGPLFGF